MACLLIYTYAGHSLRGTAKTIEVFDFLLGKTFVSLPQHTTIKTWIEKAGLDVYRNRKLSLNEVYGSIIDGSDGALRADAEPLQKGRPVSGDGCKMQSAI